jgi:hypothetical protein
MRQFKNAGDDRDSSLENVKKELVFWHISHECFWSLALSYISAKLFG